jgi:hypothetical protein
MNRKLLAVLILMIVPAFCAAGKVKIWHHNSPNSHDKADFKQVVMTTEGEVRLARQLRPLADIEAAHVWAVVEDTIGNLYVATGNEGKIFKVSKNDRATLVYQSEDSQVLSLAVGADGTVYAGTGPGGRIIRIPTKGEPAIFANLGPTYVWSLAFDAKGKLFAGMGPKGQVFAIARDGSSEVFYTTKQEHVLCLAFGPDDQLYAGTGKNGLVYRIGPSGKGTVLFDAPQSEVRTLLATKDAVYAGTSAPVARRTPGSAAAGRGERSENGITGVGFAPAGRTPAGSGSEAADKTGLSAPVGSSGTSPTGGSPAPSIPPPSGKENSVYRLSADGTVRELFRDKVMVLSLLQQGNRLLIGTGGDGQLFEVTPKPRQRTELARLNHTQVHCLCERSDGSLVLGAGDPGRLYVMEKKFVEKGTLTSEVLDAKMLSRWGALAWQADTPSGAKISIATRSGNVADPDETWSDWSQEQHDPQKAVAAAPPGRFLQYRATLVSDTPRVTPTLKSVAVRYQAVNVAPEVGAVEVPDYDAVTLDNPKKVKIRWTATDANEDELTYTLYYRKDGWANWVELETDFEKREYEWDTTTTPAGMYQFKVVASDRRDNSDEEALTSERISKPFVVDHLPPAVAVKLARIDGDRAVMEATAADTLTRLVSASFSVDSRKWTNVFPTDGLFDGKNKLFEFKTEGLKPGTHVLVLRVTDAAGNTGSSDVVFQVPGK